MSAILQVRKLHQGVVTKMTEKELNDMLNYLEKIYRDYETNREVRCLLNQIKKNIERMKNDNNSNK